MIHEKKILPKYFHKVHERKKTFEIRKNDCNYQVNDYVLLKEWNDRMFTGNEILAKITYVLKDVEGLEKDYCIFSMELIDYNMRNYSSGD